MIGPSFADELKRAGLADKVKAWNSDGSIPARNELSEADCAALDAVLAAHDPNKQAAQPVIDGAAFLARVADDEYSAITSSSNVQVRRWLDIFRLRGEIDVTGNTAKSAKAGLVALGLLTQKRADEIFKS